MVGFIDCIREKEVYVYGGGMMGKVVVSYLSAIEKIFPKAIVVSDGHREDYEYITADGICFPIVELSSLSLTQDKSSAVFINTVVSGGETVEQILKDKKFEIVQLPNGWYDIIEANYQEYYFKKIGLDFSKEILEFRNVKCYNPVFLKKELKDIIFRTMGDEITVPLYNDYSLTVDGAYEYGKVTCEPGDVVIDAGANIGMFACYAAEKGCKVFACEPDQHALAVLYKQKEIYDNIEIIDKGLSDREGKVSFYESRDNCLLSSIGMPRGNVDETAIDITTIDKLLETGVIPRVDYIKADIEGAERDMLRGAVNAMKEYSPKLAICTYHYAEDKELLEGIIKKANPRYVVEHKWRKLFAYVPE